MDVSVSTQVSIDGDILDVFEKVFVQLGISNYTIHTAEGSEKGNNFMGIITKAQVKGVDKNGKNVTKSFIIKHAHTTEGYRKMDDLVDIYELEIYVYSTLLPVFENFQKERQISEPFIGYPKFYASSLKDCHEALIFEDMSEKGYITQTRMKCLNVEHYIKIMNELGKWHALSFALKDQEPEVYKRLRTERRGKYIPRSIIEDSINRTIKEVASSFDPAAEKAELEMYNKITKTLVDDVFILNDVNTANGYDVILHGDFLTTNLMFQYEGTESMECPSNVCFLDWQRVRFASPLVDIVNIIYICTDKELRDNYFERIIKAYYSSLANFVKDLGSDIEKLYPENVFREDLKKFSILGLGVAHLAVPILTRTVDDAPDMIEETSRGKEIGKIMEDLVISDYALERLRDCFMHIYKNFL